MEGNCSPVICGCQDVGVSIVTVVVEIATLMATHLFGHMVNPPITSPKDNIDFCYFGKRNKLYII